MEDPRIISTQFNSPKMPYYNVLVNSFQTLRKSAYECYRYDITKKNKIESNVRFIYGSGESFPAQSEEIIAGCTPKLINSKIYDNKGHAEILSCYPEKIVNIIKNILHSKQL